MGRPRGPVDAASCMAGPQAGPRAGEPPRARAGDGPPGGETKTPTVRPREGRERESRSAQLLRPLRHQLSLSISTSCCGRTASASSAARGRGNSRARPSDPPPSLPGEAEKSVKIYVRSVQAPGARRSRRCDEATIRNRPGKAARQRSSARQWQRARAEGENVWRGVHGRLRRLRSSGIL